MGIKAEVIRPVWEASKIQQWVHPRKKPALRRALVYEVLAPLLRVVTSDPSYHIRVKVLSELNNTSLDADMCETSHIHMLLNVTNDEWAPIRRLAYSECRAQASYPVHTKKDYFGFADVYKATSWAKL